MEDEFMVEEGESSRRPFLIAVGALLTIFILAAVCSAAILLSRQNANRNAQIAAIETENAIIAVTNEAVTLTVAAMQTADARPTDTPTPTATLTPSPTFTNTPTSTPVVAQAETLQEEEATPTPNLSGTSVFETQEEESTPTPIAAFAEEELPQTGIGTWGALVAAFILVMALVAARRLRQG
ncbi:MAG: hypothetical protein D6706_17855 [Chloroflexi bacterium]|nr:MAG: hypothetical protein D6706_17855 [Chloroflexota bacterium]